MPSTSHDVLNSSYIYKQAILLDTVNELLLNKKYNQAKIILSKTLTDSLINPSKENVLNKFESDLSLPEKLFEFSIFIDEVKGAFWGRFFKFEKVTPHPYVDISYKNKDSIKINIPLEARGLIFPNIYHVSSETTVESFKNLNRTDMEKLQSTDFTRVNNREVNSIILSKDQILTDSIKGILAYPNPIDGIEEFQSFIVVIPK